MWESAGHFAVIEVVSLVFIAKINSEGQQLIINLLTARLVYRIYSCSVVKLKSSVIHTNFYNSSAVAEMGDRLAIIGMGRKWGGAAVGARSPLGPHLT